MNRKRIAVLVVLALLVPVLLVPFMAVAVEGRSMTTIDNERGDSAPAKAGAKMLGTILRFLVAASILIGVILSTKGVVDLKTLTLIAISIAAFAVIDNLIRTVL